MCKLLSFALAASAAFAQVAVPRLVNLNLVATDAQGHRVTDLTAAEVQVTDQGKASPIVLFRNEPAGVPAAPAAHEFSNRPAPAVSHVQVILFDVLNLSMAGRQPAVDQIVRALEGLESGDAVYLYLLNLNGDLVPVRALPDGTTDLRPAGTPWTRGVRPILERALGPVAAVQQEIQRDVARRVQSTYAALETLAGRLAPLPGRKNILWLTFGVPCALDTGNGQRWDCRPTLNKVTVKLDQANVAVSPVTLQSATDPEIRSTLQQLVESTGGKFYSGGDIERAIPDAVELGRSYYRVQYVPPANGWDGKVHKIRATSTRKGVNLQSKLSYTAERTPPPVSDKDRNIALFESPFDAADFGLSVITSPAAQPHALHLRITLDPRELLLIPQADKFAVQLSLYVAAYLPDNKLQTYDPTPVNVSLTAEQVEKMSRDGMHLGNDVLVAEGVHKIRLLVVDRASSAFSTVTIPVN